MGTDSILTTARKWRALYTIPISAPEQTARKTNMIKVYLTEDNAWQEGRSHAVGTSKCGRHSADHIRELLHCDRIKLKSTNDWRNPIAQCVTPHRPGVAKTGTAAY